MKRIQAYLICDLVHMLCAEIPIFNELCRRSLLNLLDPAALLYTINPLLTVLQAYAMGRPQNQACSQPNMPGMQPHFRGRPSHSFGTNLLPASPLLAFSNFSFSFPLLSSLPSPPGIGHYVQVGALGSGMIFSRYGSQKHSQYILSLGSVCDSYFGFFL